MLLDSYVRSKDTKAVAVVSSKQVRVRRAYFGSPHAASSTVSPGSYLTGTNFCTRSPANTSPV